MKNILNSLYAIGGANISPIIAEKALKGGAKIYQLREKNLSDRDLLSIAEKLRDLCAKYNAEFVINDRVDLARKLNCGAHIGGGDESLRKAREILGDNAIIGVSCYDDLDRAKFAEKHGASYVSFGACFRSRTKPNAPVLKDHKIFAENFKIPKCAIGGITLENAEPLAREGANLIAVITALWEALDVEKTAREFTRICEIKQEAK
ncbi:MAG: thiamine phosphate synthase [Helicobacteraceae bacterium]|nr:thiamine phosphate synthase [Helicobacteraceae bacterium]